jgi:glycosyltransferase involved in cell wall biosynthesis
MSTKELLLSICVPTYNRDNLVFKCINSITSQIDESTVEEIAILVVNDKSTDDTELVLSEINHPCVTVINRKSNMGMSANIYTMLTKDVQSKYTLILTDDDYLEAGSIQFLVNAIKANILHGSVIWSPRFSYDDDDNLITVACNDFRESCSVPPGYISVAKYANSAFILSGLILKMENLKTGIWRNHIENSYFPLLLAGENIFINGGGFIQNKLVYHRVLNKCHWSRWGATQSAIEYRLLKDKIESFYILKNFSVTNPFESLKFEMVLLNQVLVEYLQFFNENPPRLFSPMKLILIRQSLSASFVAFLVYTLTYLFPDLYLVVKRLHRRLLQN